MILVRAADFLSIGVKYIDDMPDEIIITGCGTSYYLPQAATSIIEKFLHIAVRAVPSSELFLFPDIYLHGQKVLLIAVSRSVQTIETIKAVQVF
jgi:glucosamine--fructose-6-phosphate aminotransferase (isomerizing)